MRFALALLLLFSLQPTPPTVVWTSPTRVFVSWQQEVSGERCLSKEAPDGTIYDYGCYWFFGEIGPGIGMPLPFGRQPPAAAYPQTGDTIIVSGRRASVGLHLAYLPVIAAP